MDSINRKIFKASFLILTLTIVVKAFSLFREVAIANFFGRGDELDVFLIAMMVPAFFVNLISGSFNAALIPTYIKTKAELGRAGAQNLFSSIMTFTIIILTTIALILWLTSGYYLPLLASGFSHEKLMLTRKILILLLPLLLINGVISIWSSILNSSKKFTLVAISPVFIPVLSIIFIYLFNRHLGIYSLVYGILVGSILNMLILIFGLNREKLRLKFGWKYNEPLRKVINQYCPMVAGALLMGSTIVVDRAMAAMLPAGSVAALGYGYKVIALAAGLLTLAFSNAILPYFSEQEANKDDEGIKNTFNLYFIVSLSISLALMSFVFLFSRPIVTIIFQKGAFGAADTAIVSNIQRFYSFMIPSYVLGILGVRLISVKLGNRILMYGAIINLISNIILNIVFIRFFGIAGIALSTSFVYLISVIFIMSFVLLKYKITLSRKYTASTVVTIALSITALILLGNIASYSVRFAVFTAAFIGIFIISMKISGRSIGAIFDNSRGTDGHR